MIASYGAEALRGAILSVHGELRSRGQLAPALPPLAPAPELAPALARCDTRPLRRSPSWPRCRSPGSG